MDENRPVEDRGRRSNGGSVRTRNQKRKKKRPGLLKRSSYLVVPIAYLLALWGLMTGFMISLFVIDVCFSSMMAGIASLIALVVSIALLPVWMTPTRKRAKESVERTYPLFSAISLLLIPVIFMIGENTWYGEDSELEQVFGYVLFALILALMNYTTGVALLSRKTRLGTAFKVVGVILSLFFSMAFFGWMVSG